MSSCWCFKYSSTETPLSWDGCKNRFGTRPYSPYVVDSVPPPNPRPSNISSGSGLRAFNNLESKLEVWLSASDGACTILLL